MDSVFDLVAFAAIGATTLLLGRALLVRFDLSFGSTVIDFALAGGLGLGVLSNIIFVLSASHLLWMPAWTVLATMLIASVLVHPERPSSLRPVEFGRVKVPEWDLMTWGLSAVVVAHLAMNFAAALAPPTGVDPLVYHLAVPATYLREGGMVSIPSLITSNMPFAIQMNFLFSLWIHGGSVAQLLNSWALGLTALALFGLVRRSGPPLVGLLAVALYVSISDVVNGSSVALVDVMAALFLLMSFIGMIAWLDHGGHRWLVLAGVFGGLFAANRVSNAGWVLGLGVALVVYSTYRERAFRWSVSFKPMAIFGLCSLIVVVPWYVRSYIYTGNPVYPFLYDIFAGKYINAEWAAKYLASAHSKTLGARSVVGFVSLPWVMTTDPAQYRSGVVGPVYLAALPFLWFYRRSLPRWVGFAVVFTVVSVPIWYLTFTRLRSILFVMILLSALVAIAVVSLLRHDRAPRLLKTTALATVALWLAIGLTINWRAHGDAILAAIGIEDRDAYADTELRDTGFKWYRDYQELNRLLPEDANVLIFDTRGYYLDRGYVVSLGLTMGMATPEEIRSPPKMLALLDSLEVTHAAWDPSGTFDAAIRDTLVASGCMSLVFESDTILVSRIERSTTCFQ